MLPSAGMSSCARLQQRLLSRKPGTSNRNFQLATNMGRLADLSSNPMVLTYAQGVAERTITPIGNFLAPTVSVETHIGQYKVYDEKSRFKLPNTERPAGGKAAKIIWTSSDANYNCRPNALDVVLDQAELAESRTQGINEMKEAATLAAHVGTLSHERDVVTKALAQLGAGTDVNLLATDPVDEIDAQLDAIGLAAAGGSITELRVLFGPTAWRYFKNCPFVRSRFVAAGSKAIPNISTTDASNLFTGNPAIMICRSATDTAGEGLDPVMAYLMTTSVIIFAAATETTRRDPSFMKTFRLNGQWLGPRTYLSEDGRQEVAGFDWSHQVTVTNTLGAVRLNLTKVAP